MASPAFALAIKDAEKKNVEPKSLVKKVAKFGISILQRGLGKTLGNLLSDLFLEK